jgi:DNA-binding SARP family transcriptional activator
LALSALNVRLLGGFSLLYQGLPIAGLNKARWQSLLAYLILRAGAPQPRQQIAFLFWPDTLEAHARNNLRQSLHQIRLKLPEPDRFLAVNANEVCWQADEGQVIDVELFRQALSAADRAARGADTPGVRQGLEQALAHYQGDLLPNCYDDWINPEREQLRQLHHMAMQKLARAHEAQQEYALAAQTMLQLLRLDPLDENGYIELMRLQSLNHDRPAIRRTHQSAVETLRRELDIQPGEALEQAYERYQHAAGAQPARAEHDLRAGPSTTLVGRRDEWQQLQAAWQRALAGETQLALVTGEAGIGKSRLAEELFNQAQRQGVTSARTRSYAAEGRLSLAPVTEWLRSPALRPHLAGLDDVWLTDVARLLPELLDELPTLARPEPIGEYGQRQRFFEALARAVLAAPPPILLWIDDLQWCDLETLEWLHFLLRFQPRCPLLVLGTARSEESPLEHPLSGLARQLRTEGKLTAIPLEPLDAAETARLAWQIQGQELELAATLRLFRETEGNPLFVVETVRAGLGRAPAPEAGLAPGLEPGPRPVPPRVYAVIAGRLAQLSPLARKVAEQGAAIGRAFTLDLLLRAAYDPEASMVQALDELWQKRIVREQSANVFDFTHDKLCEIAYAEISAPQRRLLHRRIAQALEALYADNLDPVSGQIAAQFDQAGAVEQALPYYQRAGAIAARVYANEDAIAFLTRGLALLPHLAPDAKREAQELKLHLALSPLYRMTQGWTAPEVERGLNRARILSEKVGEADQAAQALFGLQMYHVVAGHLEWVQSTYPELLRLFEQGRGQAPVWAGLVHAIACFQMGRLREASEQLARIVAVPDEAQAREYQSSHGLSYLAQCHVFQGHAAWCLGFPRRAMEHMAQAARYVRDNPQPGSRAMAVMCLAHLHDFLGDDDAFRARAEEAYALTAEHQILYYQAWATILVNFAHTWQTPDTANVTQLSEAIVNFSDIGAHVRLPYFFSLLARACQRAGQLQAGQQAVEQGLVEAQQTSQHWWDAELYRLRGELRWAQGAGLEEVEAAFQGSLQIARAQRAKSLELRAATSLARLWQSTGRAAPAQALLAPLVGWFGDGFETVDLQAARALLAQL